ncbi:hypothetical protein Cni_G24327 [Canna indica]|uniref:Uncharacterized protein n=1 Tax=Canna indica TaxID=4628 RepID=A0AAQ3QJZ7_9LILI|nr:hypothetical protein Cni_G24327 [Canna indica]
MVMVVMMMVVRRGCSGGRRRMIVEWRLCFVSRRWRRFVVVRWGVVVGRWRGGDRGWLWDGVVRRRGDGEGVSWEEEHEQGEGEEGPQTETESHLACCHHHCKCGTADAVVNTLLFI